MPSQRTSADNLLYPQPPTVQQQADGPRQTPTGPVYSERQMGQYGLSMERGETCWIEPDYTSQVKIPALAMMGAAPNADSMPDDETANNIVRF